MNPDEKYMSKTLPGSEEDLKFGPLNTTPQVGWNFKDLFDLPCNMRMAPQINNSLNSPGFTETADNIRAYLESPYLPSYNPEDICDSKAAYKETTTPAEFLRKINLEVGSEDTLRCSKDADMNKIMKEIEEDCPGVLSLFEAYNIPSPIAKLIVRRISKIALRHCSKSR